MAKGRAQRSEAAPRPLELDPSAPREPTGRPMRSSTSARTRSGSWSMTNSAGRRCLASTKNRLPASRKDLPKPAPSRPTTFAAPSRPCGDFAPSPTPWASAESTPWRPRPCVALRTGRSSPRRSRRSAASRCVSSAGLRKRGSATFGVISGFFRPVGTVGDMGGGSLEVAEAIDDHVGDRWVSLPLGALPVEAMLSEGLSAAKRRDRRNPAAKPAARAGEAGVLSGRRRLARAGESAHGSGRRAGQSRARLYARRRRERANSRARSRGSPSAKLAATPGVTERRARTLPAAALTLRSRA